MALITYENKVALKEEAEIADINKVTDNDMNEIKQVVNENYNLSQGTTLFESAGSYTGITLNDSASNYKFFYIETIGLQYTSFIKNNSIIIKNPNGKSVTQTNSACVLSPNGLLYTISPIFGINGTTITITNNQALVVGANTAYAGNSNVIGITKVIGYK